jgi:hypothetical protein
MMPSKYGVCLGTILMLSFISSCVSAFSLQTCNANTYTNEHQIVLVPLQLFLEFIDALHDGRQEVDNLIASILQVFDAFVHASIQDFCGDTGWQIDVRILGRHAHV